MAQITTPTELNPLDDKAAMNHTISDSLQSTTAGEVSTDEEFVTKRLTTLGLTMQGNLINFDLNLGSDSDEKLNR